MEEKVPRERLTFQLVPTGRYNPCPSSSSSPISNTSIRSSQTFLKLSGWGALPVPVEGPLAVVRGGASPPFVMGALVAGPGYDIALVGPTYSSSSSERSPPVVVERFVQPGNLTSFPVIPFDVV